jgi:hypothetical protein
LSYPEVSTARQLAAAAMAFPVGAAIGLSVYHLLGGLRRTGAIGAFLARWWGWYSGLVAGLTAAVAIAGPYMFARGTASS